MKLRLRSPRELARVLRLTARRRPSDVEEYLDAHTEEWGALVEATPGDAADILEELPGDAAVELLQELDREGAAEVLEELNPELAVDLLEDLPVADVAGLLAVMTPEGAADVLAAFEDETTAGEVLQLMPAESAAEVRQLLVYAPDSAGGVMTTDVASLPLGMTAGEAIERLRHLHEELEDLSYVYVVDDGNRLMGVLSFRDLVFVRPGVGLDEAMMPNPVSVRPETDREEVAEIVQRYHLFGLPVVDAEGRLLGMVNTEAVIEAVQREASEDFAVAMGAGVEETVRSPVGRSIRSRLPWIVFDVFISSSVVIAISRFDDVLRQFTVLAALMPLIARIGGDAGAQALAVVIRGLAADDVPTSSTGFVVRREVVIGVMNGLAIGVVAGLLGFLMQTVSGGVQPVKIGLVMMIAALANLILAGFAGSGIPLLLRRLGADPALASNLFLTTLTDLLGFAGFLGVAKIFLT